MRSLPAAKASANDLATARSIKRIRRDAGLPSPPSTAAIQHGRGRTPAGWDALLEGALCRRAVGDLQTSRIYLQQRRSVDSPSDRARQELGLLDMQIAQTQQGNVGPGAAIHAAPRAAMHASEAPAAAPPPAATASPPCRH